MTTTHGYSEPPATHPEPVDRGDGSADWSSFMDDMDDVEVSRVEDLAEKQML